jgi:steroid delta-isomerase
MTPDKRQKIAAYADLFGRLRPEDLPGLREMLAEQVVFQDPFSRLVGPAAFVSVFEHMFEVMDEPAFAVLDIAFSDEAAYLKWRMTGRVRRLPALPITITGMSEVRLDAKGQVIAHLDHWDSASQLLVHLPVLGRFVGWLLGRFQAPAKR